MSIGAISEATGIPPATLRTWERRYGFPNPERTASGHRRFDPQVIEQLRLTSRALDAGHRASDIVGLPEDKLRRLLTTSDDPPSSRPQRLSQATQPSDDSWLSRLLVASRRLDGETLERQMRTAWNRLGALEFLESRAAPFLQRLGEAWASGALTVAHEHYASEQVRDFLSDKWREITDRSTGPRILCVAPEGELHAIGLHLAAVVLGLAGFQVVFLGPNTPVEDVIDVCSKRDVQAVAVTVASSYEPGRATDYFQRLRDNCPHSIEVIAGGEGTPPGLEGVRTFDSLDELFDWATNFVETSATP